MGEVEWRAAAFPVATTWGEAATSDCGPTDGNGFDTRWAEDLALLVDHGVGAVRLAVDWPRIQPRRGQVDPAWWERTEATVDEARRLGLEVWVTLHEAGVPRWFDDEGGFDDAVAAGRWWPRWVESVAERIGDRVDGWIPLVPTVSGRRALWRDTWGVLRGGPPVTAVVTLPGDLDELRRDRDDDRIAPCDRAGIVVEVPPVATDVERRRAEERLGDHVRAAVELGPDRPLVVADLTSAADDRADHARALEIARRALGDAEADGVRLTRAFAAPAVDGLGRLGLFDLDREPTASSDAWVG